MMMPGMAKMRPQVSRFGIEVACEGKRSGSGMQVLVDRLRQRFADTAHLRKVVDTRPQYALQAAELLQQLPAARRAEPRNGFERRFVVPPGAPAPVTEDRETMRLVAHALDQVQRC